MHAAGNPTGSDTDVTAFPTASDDGTWLFVATAAVIVTGNDDSRPWRAPSKAAGDAAAVDAVSATRARMLNLYILLMTNTVCGVIERRSGPAKPSWTIYTAIPFIACCSQLIWSHWTER